MELLICLTDKLPTDSVVYEGSLRRGHVIVICPEGWPWSPVERSNPDWKIVSSDITEIESDALTAAPMTGNAQRAIRLNVDDLPDALLRAELMARVL